MYIFERRGQKGLRGWLLADQNPKKNNKELPNNANDHADDVCTECYEKHGCHFKQGNSKKGHSCTQTWIEGRLIVGLEGRRPSIGGFILVHFEKVCSTKTWALSALLDRKKRHSQRWKYNCENPVKSIGWRGEAMISDNGLRHAETYNRNSNENPVSCDDWCVFGFRSLRLIRTIQCWLA